MLLMIDNYDSFTYNLVQGFQALGETVVVLRHDAMDLTDIDRLNPDRLVISPGPGTPDTAGISLAALQYCAGRIPILGVCLGHQCLAQYFGARIIRAPAVMHGKTSAIHHEGQGIFAGLPSPFSAMRYHSLVVDPDTVPAMLEVTAWTQDEQGGRQLIMGLRHRALPLEGIQFHPESILTQDGMHMLQAFLENPT